MNATLVENIEFSETPVKQRGEGRPLIGRDLSMLEHVAVTLEVVVGHATTTVKDLFAFADGDTIALDTDLDGPVALQVDGKLVARGHLVAVGDKFGFRITEVA